MWLDLTDIGLSNWTMRITEVSRGHKTAESSQGDMWLDQVDVFLHQVDIWLELSQVEVWLKIYS